MKPLVIDTNVPIVANGGERSSRQRQSDASPVPSEACREAAILRLSKAIKAELILLDCEGKIQDEYRRYLNPSGQPGVGDRFYLHVLNSAPGRVERRNLELASNGEYLHLPESLVAGGFDPSDRKFAALAKQENGVVINATDSDWLLHAQELSHSRVEVQNICGCDKTTWFQ